MKLPKTIEEVQEFLGCEDKYISHNNSSSITSIFYDELLQCLRAYEEKHKKKSKWIKWEGGDCPVPPNTIVKVKLNNMSKATTAFARDVNRGRGVTLSWVDVIAYRGVIGGEK